MFMAIYYVIQVIETFSHHYTLNYQKHDQARDFLKEICSNTEMMKWDSIHEQCRQQREIFKRNPLWETIVDTSKLFHVCYKKKHLHDEQKEFGHDHQKAENGAVDDEMDCSFFAVFVGGILTAFFLIVYVLKFTGNSREKMKSKTD